MRSCWLKMTPRKTPTSSFGSFGIAPSLTHVIQMTLRSWCGGKNPSIIPNTTNANQQRAFSLSWRNYCRSYGLLSKITKHSRVS